MTNIIVMLILLTAPYLAVRVLSVVSHKNLGAETKAAAAIGLGLLFTFTGIGHFIQTAPMVTMLPERVPHRTLIVYLTGLLEFAIAIGFFVPPARRYAGIVAIVVLVVFFPANIYAAINQAPMGAHSWGAIYLLVRAPMQVVIIVWAYWFTVKRPA